MVKEKTSGERRKFNRFKIEIPVECRPIARGRKRGERGLVYAIVKNISSNGILMEWPTEYRLPQFLRLGIRVVDTSKPIESIARTVWTKEKRRRGKAKAEPPEQYDVGLSFVEDEYNKVPRLVSRGTNFYWDIFERTGHIQAYLLHKGIGKECEQVPRDG